MGGESVKKERMMDMAVIRVEKVSDYVDFRVSGGGAVKGITKITFYGDNLGGYGMAARIPFRRM